MRPQIEQLMHLAVPPVWEIRPSKQQIGRTVTSVKQDEISDALRECMGKIVEKCARKCPSISLSPRYRHEGGSQRRDGQLVVRQAGATAL